MTDKVWIVIPAAGIGKRMQTDIPKQYLKISGKTVLQHTLDCFANHKEIEGIIVALQDEDTYWNAANIDVPEKKLYTVEGGEERSDSVLNALEYLTLVEQLAEETWIMVHDAARPCLPSNDIDSLLKIRSKTIIGGILASPVRDTMKRAKTDDSKQISQTENRSNLWHALTPQLFRLGELRVALKTCLEKGLEVTDEASALEAQGESPLLVEGSSNNIKITQPDDLKLASLFLSQDQSKDDIQLKNHHV